MINVQNLNITLLWQQGKVICVTTNGFVKKDGTAVMGRGNALAMAKIIPELPKNLATHLTKYGNTVGLIYDRIIAFPVKPDKGNWEDALDHIKKNHHKTDSIPGFWCKASPTIIEKSLNRLNQLIDFYKLNEVYLPVPGVKNGALNLADIDHILQKANKQIIFCSNDTQFYK